MTSKENLNQIIESMPSDTPEIKHIILKSQNKKGYRPTLWQKK